MIALEHQADFARRDLAFDFEYFTSADREALCSTDLYGWGDFIWAGCSARTMPSIGHDTACMLLYFGLRRRVEREAFGADIFALFAVHDDGWYLRCRYADESLVKAIVGHLHNHGRVFAMKPQEIVDSTDGLFFQYGAVTALAGTRDIDRVLNQHYRRGDPRENTGA